MTRFYDTVFLMVSPIVLFVLSTDLGQCVTKLCSKNKPSFSKDPFCLEVHHSPVFKKQVSTDSEDEPAR